MLQENTCCCSAGTPQHFKLLLSSTPSSSLILSPDPQESSPTTSLSPLCSPFDILTDGSSSQPRLRQSQKSDKQSWRTSLSDFPSPVAVQQSMSLPSRIVETSSSCTGCGPSFHVGISVVTMVHIVSRPIGSCQRAMSVDS